MIVKYRMVVGIIVGLMAGITVGMMVDLPHIGGYNTILSQFFAEFGNLIPEKCKS